MFSDIDQCSIAFRGGNRFARVKRTRVRPIKCCMEFRHSCSFCGWSRASATSVMLAPRCDECGCVLDAVPAVATVSPTTPAFSLPPLAAFVLIRGAIVLAALALYAAAKLGYDAAGASGALIALGAAGFLLLPCVPDRIR
jgi:ribosomal protein L37AE/L43A